MTKVYADQLRKHLAGLISKQTLFNAATKGDGPASFMIGNRRYSQRDVLVDWLASR